MALHPISTPLFLLILIKAKGKICSHLLLLSAYDSNELSLTPFFKEQKKEKLVNNGCLSS